MNSKKKISFYSQKLLFQNLFSANKTTLFSNKQKTKQLFRFTKAGAKNRLMEIERKYFHQSDYNKKKSFERGLVKCFDCFQF
jgi:hypothetical protein